MFLREYSNDLTVSSTFGFPDRTNVLFSIFIIVFQITVNDSNTLVSISPNSVSCWIDIGKEICTYFFKIILPKVLFLMIWLDDRH